MRKSLKRVLASVLSAALLVSAMSMTVLAAPGEGPGGPGGGGPGGPGGGGPGGPGGGQSSSAIDLTGMLSLNQYVFVGGENNNGTVTTAAYGAYAKGGEGEVAFVPAAFTGEISVYLDKAMTQPAEGVAAEVANGTFTMTGVAKTGNVAYYLSTGDGAYATTIYVVNDQYTGSTATLTLADGTTLDLTTYAPNMAKGNYTATVDAVNAQGAVYVGGNRTIRTAADYGITDAADAAAVNWFLSSGLTNAGKSLTEFGDVMYGFEYAVDLYRMFQLVIEENLLAADFKYPTDSVGGMGHNDQYSDAVDAILHAGILNGIYTKNSETLKNKGGVPLIENLNEDTTFGATVPVSAEFAFVTLYNAITSRWSMLSEQGKAVAAALKASNAVTNAEKMAKLAEVLGVTVPENGTMSKIDVVKLLYAARGCVQSKTSPDDTFAAQTGSEYSNMLRFYDVYHTPVITSASDAIPESLISAAGSALLVNNAGTINIHNKTVSLTGNSDDAAGIATTTQDPNVLVDGKEGAEGGKVGFLYNATMRNAFYREGIGSAMAIWGKNSVVNLTSDNGTLVIDGEAKGSSYPAGTMAGTVYVGFGASLNVTNAVAYSSSQHLTNVLYNGNVHFKDAAAFGSGRVYSSDFWGGYQVFENSIATGGSVTDEPTTLIVKNSVYGNSVGGNGFASQYFENSILNVGTASFQNTTSLITDTGSLTLVNSKLNSTSGTFASSTKGERVIVTLVDSEIDMSKGNVLAKVDNYTTLNSQRPGFSDNGMFNGEMVIDLVGDNYITTSDGTLTATIAEGASLTIKGKVIDADGNDIDFSGITGVTVVPGDGVLKVERTAHALTYGEAADVIAALMKDSGVYYTIPSQVEGGRPTQVMVYTADDVYAAMQAAGILENAPASYTAITGAGFDTMLAKALNTASLEGIGEFAPSTKATMTKADAEAVINSVVLWAKGGANLTGDTNKFLCIESGST